jgi:hypothetical protein
VISRFASIEDACLAIGNFELWLQHQAWELRGATIDSRHAQRDMDRIICEFRALVRCAEQQIISGGTLSAIRRAYADALRNFADDAEDQLNAQNASKRLADLRSNIERWAERFAPQYDPLDMSPMVVTNLQLKRSALALQSSPDVK